jgi:hypothetical protein
MNYPAAELRGIRSPCPSDIPLVLSENRERGKSALFVSWKEIITQPRPKDDRCKLISSPLLLCGFQLIECVSAG